MGLKGIHSNTGSEFSNKPADQWCLRHGAGVSVGLRPTKTTIAMPDKRIMPRFARLPGISATRGRRGLPPCKPSMTLRNCKRIKCIVFYSNCLRNKKNNMTKQSCYFFTVPCNPLLNL
jgi:hypothetical protein